MAARFKTVTVTAVDTDRDAAQFTPFGAGSPDVFTESIALGLPQTATNEALARYYADQVLASEEDGDFNPIIGPADPALVPGLALAKEESHSIANTVSLFFEQMARNVPVFGTNAIVEIDADSRRLVSFDARLTSAPEVPAVATISPGDALTAIEQFCGVELDHVELAAPALYFFAEPEGGDWHLVYLFAKVPAAPKDIVAEAASHGHGLDTSPRQQFLAFDYLVDAHDAKVVYYYSAQPMLDLPVACTGDDEVGVNRQFWGRGAANGFELVDPLRNIETMDHGLKDITVAPAGGPIGNAAPGWGTKHTAGVSAHYNAQLVFDYFNGVLKRNGIDGKGTKLVSMVNCTYSQHGPGPSWRNAVWWGGRMWYGQTARPGGGFNSFSRYLDIIAHELTHGVTESTANLVYKDVPGALNKSFSDIFGVIVSNWFPNQPNSLSNWSWEIGSGLGAGGGPMRDLSNPTRTGHPDHWSKRKHIGTTHDFGGVHFNSNIHNKAAFNLFHENDAAGNAVLSPADVGLLYYLALTRLSRMSTFSDIRRTLSMVSDTYFRGDATKSTAARAAIARAYDAVGIV